MYRGIRFMGILVSILGILASCSKEDEHPSPDVTPPAAIMDLSVCTGISSGSVDLTWTAVGDDGYAGRATAYIARYSESPLTPENFNEATTYVQTWTTLLAGAMESRTIMGLIPGQMYSFAIKVRDEVFNVSGMSNVVDAAASTAGDILPPAPISNLQASPGNAPGQVDLTWTATGDDGNTGRATTYIVKYSWSPIQSSEFDAARTYTQSWDPMEAGETELRTVSGFTPGQTYHFAIKVEDEVPNTSDISNGSGATAAFASGTAVGWIGGGRNGWQTEYCYAGWNARSFDRPYDISTDGVGNIYAVDRNNHRICKWDGQGNALGWIGGGRNGWQTGEGAVPGSDVQSFQSPVRLFVEPGGTLYVADRGNHRICKWDSQGNSLGWIGGGQDGWQTGDGAAAGSDDRSFNGTFGVCLDGSGNIYVADFGNARICKWDAQGNGLGWIGGGLNGWQSGNGAPSGYHYRAFRSPLGVYLDGVGNIYVADAGGNARICKWDPNGTALGWIGDGSNGWKTVHGATWGPEYQRFYDATGVFVDGAGNIYIPENVNNRISKWDAGGNALGWIGGGSDGWKTSNGAASGRSTRSFRDPIGVHVDSQGNILVADSNNHRIAKWDASGHSLGCIGSGMTGWQTSSTQAGSDVQSFDGTFGVWVDGTGNIFVADRANHRIAKWDGSGNAIGWIGGGRNGWQTGNGGASGSDVQSFYSPVRVFVDGNGAIYVSDLGNQRISKWSANGTAIGWIGGGQGGWQTGQGAPLGSDVLSFNGPYGVWVDGNGELYVADHYNSRVCKWDAQGNAIAWIGGGQNGWQTGSGAVASSGYQSFQNPMGVSLDSQGNIYVADAGGNERICKWDAQGNAIGWLGGGRNGWRTSVGSGAGGDYQSFYGGTGVFVDGMGNIYVPENVNDRISKWDANGNALGWIGGGLNGWNQGNAPSGGTGLRQFESPLGVFVDPLGNIYVSDTGNDRVCKWQE